MFWRCIFGVGKNRAIYHGTGRREWRQGAALIDVGHDVALHPGRCLLQAIGVASEPEVRRSRRQIAAQSHPLRGRSGAFIVGLELNVTALDQALNFYAVQITDK